MVKAEVDAEIKACVSDVGSVFMFESGKSHIMFTACVHYDFYDAPEC